MRCATILLLLTLLSFPVRTLAQSDIPMKLTCSHASVVKSEVRSVTEGDPMLLTTTPVNQKGEHIPGLKPSDFSITKGRKVAEILSVEEITAVENTVMRIIFMVDNSQSMSPYLDLLRSTLEKTIRGFSDAVRVSVIFFREGEQAAPAFTYNGRPLPMIRLPYTYDKARAVDYTQKLLRERNLTRNTYLYDGAYAASQQIEADTGKVDKSFAIIFSDGEDNASEVEDATALQADRSGTVFFTIDYLTKANNFLVKLAENSGGEHFQASNAEDLAGIFEAIADKIVAKGYTLRYKFKGTPAVDLAASAQELLMEEDIIRETFPLLNYIFFAQGSAVIPDRYERLAPEALQEFDESGIEGGALDFYYNVLNVLGSRMRQLPDATLQVSGYLNNTGTEKRNTQLATDRAEAVRNYLRTVWGIDEGRISTDAAALPPVPSSSRDSLGQAENRRVELHSDSWELLKPVTFVRRIASVRPDHVVFTPTIRAEEGIDNWVLSIEQQGQAFDTRKGSQPEKSIRWNWKNRDGNLPASEGDLLCRLQVHDRAGDSDVSDPVRISVREVKRERRQNVSVTEGGITKEKISLILFPFDVAEPGDRNIAIMEQFVYPRLTATDSVTVNGYTDVIGSDEYNLKLSEQRAEAVAAQLRETLGEASAERIKTVGHGESTPLYPNALPEGRFYNRTVNLLIEKYPE
ncbi:OmpA family protein [bacterium]|nr:OmpA family protein [bacterium]